MLIFRVLYLIVVRRGIYADSERERERLHNNTNERETRHNTQRRDEEKREQRCKELLP